MPVTVLPPASSFTVVPSEGSPHINPVPGATALHGSSTVKFFRSTFDLPNFATLTLDVRASFDNDLQIFFNGHELALEGNFTTANFDGVNHRLLVNMDGTVVNGYAEGKSFSTRVATNFPSSFFQVGANEVILALRNLEGDNGGVSFRADFLMAGIADLPPHLTLVKSGSSIQLTFPDHYFGFRIESTTNLEATNWFTRSYRHQSTCAAFVRYESFLPFGEAVIETWISTGLILS